MPTTVTKTVKSSGGDYTSLAAWEAAQQGNLVSLDEIRQAECHNFEDTSMVDIDGWTTDATRYLRVYAAQNHGGVYGTSSYRLNPANTSWSLIVREEFARIEGLLVSTTSTPLQICYTFAASATSDQRWDCVIIKGTVNTTYSMRWANATTGRMTNCIAYDGTKAGCKAFFCESGTVEWLNCTSVRNTVGFRRDAGTATAKNCGHEDDGVGTEGYEGTFSGSSTNNASSFASDAPGSNPRNSVTPTFVNLAGKDFHLASGDTAWKDQGADLSGTFTVDVDGETRTGTWDIGADEYVLTGQHDPFVTVQFRAAP